MSLGCRKLVGRRVRDVVLQPVNPGVPGSPAHHIEAIVFDDGTRLEFVVLSLPDDYVVEGVLIPPRLGERKAS